MRSKLILPFIALLVWPGVSQARSGHYRHHRSHYVHHKHHKPAVRAVVSQPPTSPPLEPPLAPDEISEAQMFDLEAEGTVVQEGINETPAEEAAEAQLLSEEDVS